MINAKEIKILFMGTPEISSYVLEKMIIDGFNIVGIVSQPDRPVGRKHVLKATPTKEIGLKYQIPVYQKEKIRLEYDFIREINPDLILTLAYGQILPQGLLDIPEYGCLNLHGSLLPKYRGAAPIQYALINNDKVTGMSLMEMTKEMDAGRVYAAQEVEIKEEDNCTSLFTKMGIAAYELVASKLEAYLNNELIGIEQDKDKVTFCKMISKEEEHLDLNMPIEKIKGYINALADLPGAYLIDKDHKLKIFKARIISHEIKGNIGEIIKADKEGIYLQTKDGILSLLELQKEGKNRMDYRSFLNGNQSLLGKILS